ncbi:MAG: type I-D CRISPR-associated protein Cas7/Csc2 [Pseudomonadota bacterium]|nr:type I-D CRISPR-associated protein Cas7/Csc2 [Pseudomonadota bacterium]
MNRFNHFLGNIDHLLAESQKSEKDTYCHPALKNLGSISIVLIREVIAPVVFRNSEPEITDIDLGAEPHVRAVPNKFKYPERGRGLQILRAFQVGGRQAQNKTVLFKNQKPSDGFDLNTLVFGDSTNWENRVLPVKAAVNYSDALSVLPKHLCVDESFHNRAMEDGTLWDAAEKKNSDNLFSRHFVKPGTLLLQVLSTRGQLLPRLGLDHLLLSIGVAGSYGGQTSVTGTNIRTHIAGIYGSYFEQSETSPYRLVQLLPKEHEALKRDVKQLSAYLHQELTDSNNPQLKGLSSIHAAAMTAEEALHYQHELVARFERDHQKLAEEYQQAAPKVARFFDEWFGK